MYPGPRVSPSSSSLIYEKVRGLHTGEGNDMAYELAISLSGMSSNDIRRFCDLLCPLLNFLVGELVGSSTVDSLYEKIGGIVAASVPQPRGTTNPTAQISPAVEVMYTVKHLRGTADYLRIWSDRGCFMDNTLEQALQTFGLKLTNIANKHIMFSLDVLDRPKLKQTMVRVTDDVFRACIETAKEDISNASDKEQRLVISLRIKLLSESEQDIDSEDDELEDVYF